jgi:tetratricopeptide (TPR) repeat protein
MQLKGKRPMLRRISMTITATVTLCVLCSSLTLAATKKPKQQDQFLPNPLEINPPDPLRPLSRPNQPLTPTEREKLEAALDELDQQATAQLQTGTRQAAFDIWNRELRLRRYLGSLNEVQALSRVGDIAWSQNERKEVQYITLRLQTIQKQTIFYDSANLQFLQALGQAYQSVRSPQLALPVYNQLLTAQKVSGDKAAQIETLETIGEVNLGWFDYPSAASTYQQLLNFASGQGDTSQQVKYLQQLAYIYQQSKQPQQSIKILNQLAEIYQKQNDLEQLPGLLMAIASDYESIAKNNPKLLQEAFTNYQQAYTTAWQLEQYVRASEALEKLIALYRSQGQTEDALRTGEILVQTQELAQNYYGLMQAYDQIGQIQLERKDYPQAQAAFSKGLAFAQQLKYNEAYFTQQIQKLSGKVKL